ncbi:hypothetical protein ANCCAN_21928 [Ancylostoma caninum]|uniref:EF-hand domain-containing protein n=1 Tax=Ancylostoma caninum TaxID=29170 RepID=A0A368FN97_ANCCA|nr:hypothetical protein ANCCAN_25889 [Ancylostoma caninum]RCN32275.1 hypothetical protein ANCCAN_21928 [Ancylostoma caninum]
MNDLDKDNRVDGIEILKALTHTHDPKHGPSQTDDELITMVDAVLKDMDLNGDGYIDYAEYLKKQSL